LKIKNKKPEVSDKIENHKNFDKKTKKKKKLKVKKPN
jgi:hypothetical protein